ncbi:hypothetical protein F2A31_09385 [Acinetobacter suaedae]|uniref:Uncharacterized protein n=1 Tax=Acinetobacter suaedae TaxID=2609668 RepID=A0A5P1UXL1_9GAMM|nr:hypothetical protein [Acinetobacter sp. C16S1]QER39916.1 hypothetical protein F2A31_09385 [Acinetobacter sp. C16S1]
MDNMKRITIFVMDADSSDDVDQVGAWLEKWKDSVNVVDYSTGGWEHCWDIEATLDAVAEVPEQWLCCSEWATPEIFDQTK